MMNLKVFLAICIIIPCILGASVERVSSEEHSKDPIVVSTDSKEDDKCTLPSGLGLKNLLRHINYILPKEEMKAIAKSYANDPEIIALRTAIKSPQIQNKCKAVGHSKEYQELKDYVCRVLHLDIHAYRNLAKSLISQSQKRVATEERKGIKGFINAIDAILPHQKITALYEGLLKTDDELVKAVNHLKSKEFRQLLLNVKNNVPEYKELMNELIALGVPVDNMRDAIADTLGWSQSLDILV